MALPPAVHKLRPGLTGSHAALGGGAAPGGGDSYTGPLDIVSGAVIAYGQRALSSAMRGQPLYTIRRDSDDATQAFNSDATTGAAPVASISAFVGGGNGFAANWSDQSGNSTDALQAVSANQPGWAASALNSKPGLTFNSTTQHFLTAQTLIDSSEFSVFAVLSKRPLLSGTGSPVIGINSNNDDYANGWDTYFYVAFPRGAQPQIITWSDAKDYASGNGADYLFDGTPDQFYLIDAAWGPSASALAVDGTALTINENNIYGDGTITPALNFQIGIGCDDAGIGGTFGGTMIELIFYKSALSDPNRLAIRQNIAAYYGITLP